jgi:ionotropic kainate glutamate receptor 2
VTTALNDPFTIITKYTKELKGNDRYEGYVIDLCKELAKELNVRIEINLVKDGAWGKKTDNKTNLWNGMVGEVMRGEADIAVADLTINSDREEAVDFTYPFMSTGITILYKKPMTKETSLWSFLSPFSTIVWIYMLGAFIGVSVILFFVGRFSPYEWTNPHPCRQNDKVLENILNNRNSFWCTIGSLMQQGSDVAPK